MGGEQEQSPAGGFYRPAHIASHLTGCAETWPLLTYFGLENVVQLGNSREESMWVSVALPFAAPGQLGTWLNILVSIEKGSHAQLCAAVFIIHEGHPDPPFNVCSDFTLGA